MSIDVYADGNAISCKQGDSKVIAAFPDVCLSPPSPPAGPVPIPYPNSSFSKDMQNGSKTVTASGGEIMLKDQSFFQTSPLGNEAATRSFGGSVVTHTITGKTYYEAWSMDVMVEGQNVPRHLDLTTSNHASPPPGPPGPGTDKPGGSGGGSKPEPCPVCGKGTNPTPGQTPPYVNPPRVPKDSETLIGREGLSPKAGANAVKGAKVFVRGKNLVHRDTLHEGKGAEIEVYNGTGTRHLGAVCAHCGTMKPDSAKKGRQCAQ